MFSFFFIERKNKEGKAETDRERRIVHRWREMRSCRGTKIPPLEIPDKLESSMTRLPRNRCAPNLSSPFPLPLPSIQVSRAATGATHLCSLYALEIVAGARRFVLVVFYPSARSQLHRFAPLIKLDRRSPPIFHNIEIVPGKCIGDFASTGSTALMRVF